MAPKNRRLAIIASILVPMTLVLGACGGGGRPHGYMADYGLARRLVQEAIAHGDPCIFASWF